METYRKLRMHDRAIEEIVRSLKNIEERLGFMETRLIRLDDNTGKGNTTRNWIAVAIVVKILFDGAQAVDVNAVVNLLKVISG